MADDVALESIISYRAKAIHKCAQTKRKTERAIYEQQCTPPPRSRAVAKEDKPRVVTIRKI